MNLNNDELQNLNQQLILDLENLERKHDLEQQSLLKRLTDHNISEQAQISD